LASIFRSDGAVHHTAVLLMTDSMPATVTVEADVSCGWALAREARRQEVVYSLAAGDQPVAIMELFDWAKALGLELGPFEACLRDESTGSAVQADRSVAARAGVRGTPTLFVNGRRLQAPSQLESEIEALLALQTQRTGE